MADDLVLKSGVAVPDALGRLRRFCAEEYAYYDAIPAGDPDRVEPVDVLATVAVNSFVTNAAQVRRIHRGLAARCDSVLARIAPEADLARDENTLPLVQELLHAAVQVRGVLVPVATKVLHRKRPRLVPMLDTVVIVHYLKALGQAHRLGSTQTKPHAAAVAMTVLAAFRADLLAAGPQLEHLQRGLAVAGYPLALVRILELLVWTQVEPNGHYRAAPGEGRPEHQAARSALSSLATPAAP